MHSSEPGSFKFALSHDSTCETDASHALFSTTSCEDDVLDLLLGEFDWVIKPTTDRKVTLMTLIAMTERQPLEQPFWTCGSFCYISAIFSDVSWYPQFGQLTALSLMFFLHSGHGISAIGPP